MRKRDRAKKLFPPGVPDPFEIGEDYPLGRTVDYFGMESIQVWSLDRSGGVA